MPNPNTIPTLTLDTESTSARCKIGRGALAYGRSLRLLHALRMCEDDDEVGARVRVCVDVRLRMRGKVCVCAVCACGCMPEGECSAAGRAQVARMHEYMNANIRFVRRAYALLL